MMSFFGVFTPGSGIAATFNTPVGGVLFAVELMMREISARTLTAVAIATATATYIGRFFLGDHPSFVIPSVEQAYFHLTHFPVLISYVGLGLLAGRSSSSSPYMASRTFSRSGSAAALMFATALECWPSGSRCTS